MKKALLRLEDIQPGGGYGTETALTKLKAICDYLKHENVPFQMSVIPRSVHPDDNYDKSISDIQDPFIQSFNDTLKYLQKEDNAAIGMHGYTHQSQNSASARGFEFYAASIKSDVPPQDKTEACHERDAFINSYTYSRMKSGYEAFKKAGIEIDWGFSTPHYEAYFPQRNIIEAWSGLLYERDTSEKDKKRKVTIKDEDNPFYRGVIYVPTPLEYVKDSDPQIDVERISNELNNYTDKELASFFYAPMIEFPFIHITDSGVIYDDNSYLKQLIRKFREKGFTFVSILDLVDFIPSSKAVNIFPGTNTRLFLSDIDGDGAAEFIGWEPNTGEWNYAKVNIEKFPDRLYEEVIKTYSLGLSNWVTGEEWMPIFGDFNGDGKQDVLLWNQEKVQWKVALSDGNKFIPNKKFEDFRSFKNWKIDKSWVPFVGDFNGDGKEDILMWNPMKGEWYVALSSGSKFISDTQNTKCLWLESRAIGPGYVPLVGDFNGDGKTDIVLWQPENGNWQVAVSNGSNFVLHPGDGDFTWLKSWAKGRNWKPLIGDFNGDGMDDILVVEPSNGNWQVALSTGNQFKLAKNPFKLWAGEPNMQPFVADLNGDGKAALIARHPTQRNGSIDCAISVL